MNIIKVLFVAASIAGTIGCASKSSPNLKTFDQYERAMESYQAGRYADAEPQLLSLLAKFPQFSEGWYRLGNLYVRTGQYEAAINAYNTCLRYDSNFTKAWHNLSLVHLKVAVQVLEEGIQNNSADKESIEQLAKLRRAMLDIGNYSTSLASSQNLDAGAHKQ